MVGAHGCDTAAQCDLFQGHLHPLLKGAVEVVNDAELLVPAAGYGVGVGVVAGTGSIAVARRPDRTMLVAGGWGWILGDEGSAPGLVREAARAVRAAIDAGEPFRPARRDAPADAGFSATRRSSAATSRQLVARKPGGGMPTRCSPPPRPALASRAGSSRMAVERWRPWSRGWSAAARRADRWWPGAG